MEIRKVEEKKMQIQKAKEQSIKVKTRSIKQVEPTEIKPSGEQMTANHLVRQQMQEESVRRKKRMEESASKEQERDTRIKRAEQKVEKEPPRTSESEEPKRYVKSADKNETATGRKRRHGIRGLMYKARTVLLMKQNHEQETENQTSQGEQFVTRRVATPMLVFFTLGIILCALVAVPILAIVALIYNSPYALFFPPFEGTETVQSVTSGYVAEFNREVETLANTHEGYDAGRIIYVDYEGTTTSPTNYYDMLAVYMVKHGIGDSATIINDTTRGWISQVVDDMCDYTTSSGTEVIQNEDGTQTSQTVLYVNVSLKDYRDMVSVYGFSETQEWVLGKLMSPENLARLGYGEGPGVGQSSISSAEASRILDQISDEAQRKVCLYALSKVGYPYSQDYRDTGDYYDCSSLAFYSWKYAGVNISFGGVTTAAAEAQGLEQQGKTVSYQEMQPGDLIFYSYCQNGRYKNISHVAIYVGNGKVVEAKNQRAGVVYGDVPNPECMVLIGRPKK